MELFKDEKADSYSIIKLLIKNVWLILGFAVIGMGVGLIATFFIPKKYSSYGIVFPPNMNSNLNALEDSRFGNMLDADQLMQLFESQMLTDTIIQMYNLKEYYGVNENDAGWQQKLNKKFHRDINITKTRYYSLVISASTRDPELSAKIVNSIIEMGDLLREKIVRKNQELAYEYAKMEYLKGKERIDSLRSMIYSLKEKEGAGNELLYNHLLESDDIYSSNTNTQFVKSKEMEELVEKYIYDKETLKGLKVDFDKASRLMNKPQPKAYIVSKAFPDRKKTSPSFKLNGLLGLGGSFFFIIVFVLVRERVRDYKNSVAS